MGLDGRFTDDQLGGNLGVGFAFCDEPEDLELARCELLQPWWWLWYRGGELLDQRPALSHPPGASSDKH